MGGPSTAITKSQQTANANLMQSYSGTCNITCNNIIDHASITLINSIAGGSVYVSQVCAVNGHCAFNTSQNALVDILFKASNSSQALSAGSIIQGWGTFSDTESYQDININVQQLINQTCKISSVNDINDTDIFAANSVIGGDVYIGQQGFASGGCTLQALMQATETASGISDNCAAAGKGKKTKKSCSGKGGKSIGSYILYFGGGLVLLVIVMAVVRYFMGKKKTDQPQAQAQNLSSQPLYPESYAPEQNFQTLSVESDGFQVPENTEDIPMQNFISEDIPYMEPVAVE